MRVNELKELLKHLPGRTEILLFSNAETEDGVKLKTGIGYFDYEEKELVYLGQVNVVEDYTDED